MGKSLSDLSDEYMRRLQQAQYEMAMKQHYLEAIQTTGPIVTAGANIFKASSMPKRSADRPAEITIALHDKADRMYQMLAEEENVSES